MQALFVGYRWVAVLPDGVTGAGSMHALFSGAKWQAKVQPVGYWI